MSFKDLIPETGEWLDFPGTCRIAKCHECGRTIAVADWENPSKEMKKEYAKMTAKGYAILPSTIREARNQELFHVEGCSQEKVKN